MCVMRVDRGKTRFLRLKDRFALLLNILKNPKRNHNAVLMQIGYTRSRKRHQPSSKIEAECCHHRKKCRHNQQNRKNTTTPAQKIHLSSRALRSIIRIVLPETPKVLATEYNLRCNVSKHRNRPPRPGATRTSSVYSSTSPSARPDRPAPPARAQCTHPAPSWCC